MRNDSATCSSSAPPVAAPRRSCRRCRSGCRTSPRPNAATPQHNCERSPSFDWSRNLHDLTCHHARVGRRPRHARARHRGEPVPVHDRRPPGGRHVPHRCRRTHPRPGAGGGGAGHLPAGVRHRRLLQRPGPGPFLPAGHHRLPHRGRSGALSRADPAQPVRLLHLPRQLRPAMHAQQPDGITAGDSNSATHADELVLGANQYGKAEVRLVHVDRSAPRHRLTDLSVTSQLHGDFARAHTHGDNAAVVTTDTQKNTVFALARGGTGAPEAFGLRLADHFTSTFDWVTGGRWAIESYTWDHIPTSKTDHASEGRHDHAFVHGGTQRSEEHTSELQSRGHLVCRLLLEKKKRSYKQHDCYKTHEK